MQALLAEKRESLVHRKRLKAITEVSSGHIVGQHEIESLASCVIVAGTIRLWIPSAEVLGAVINAHCPIVAVRIAGRTILHGNNAIVDGELEFDTLAPAVDVIHFKTLGLENFKIFLVAIEITVVTIEMIGAGTVFDKGIGLLQCYIHRGNGKFAIVALVGQRDGSLIRGSNGHAGKVNNQVCGMLTGGKRDGGRDADALGEGVGQTHGLGRIGLRAANSNGV